MHDPFENLSCHNLETEDFLRNITYRNSDGQFCLIDFEFATLLDDPSVSLKPGLPDDLEALHG